MKNCTNQLSWNHIREESTWLPLHGNGHRGYSRFSQLTHTVCHMHVQFHPVLLGKPIYLLGIPQDESSSLSLQPTKYWIEFIRGTSSRQLFIRSFQVKNWNLRRYFSWREENRRIWKKVHRANMTIKSKLSLHIVCCMRYKNHTGDKLIGGEWPLHISWINFTDSPFSDNLVSAGPWHQHSPKRYFSQESSAQEFQRLDSHQGILKTSHDLR